MSRVGAEETWDWVAYIDETVNTDACWICAVVVGVDNVIGAKERLQGIVDRWAEKLTISLTGRPHAPASVARAENERQASAETARFPAAETGGSKVDRPVPLLGRTLRHA